jgi:hypothetical protein
MAKGEKDAFLFKFEYKPVFEALGYELGYQLMMAMVDYDEKGIVPDFDGVLKIAWIPIKQDLDKNRAQWEKTSEERAKAGQLGGRGHKKEENKKSNCFTEKQSEAKKANKADSDCDSDCDSDLKESIPPVGAVPDGTDLSDSPPDENPNNPEPFSHRQLYDHYMTLGLVKHKAFTPEMRNAINTARRRGNYDWDTLKVLLDRHVKVVKMTAGSQFPVKPRTLTEFFGQRVHGGTALICSEYADDGAKWLLYQNGNAQQNRGSPERVGVKPVYYERPTENYDHLAIDYFADDFEEKNGEGLQKASGGT